MRFLCIDPRWPGGTPTPEVETGFDGFRFVVFPDSFDTVAGYLNRGYCVQLVLAKESGAVEQYADWFKTDDTGLDRWFRERVTWVVGNEVDAPEGSPSSWTMNPEEYWQLWNRSKVLNGKRYVSGQSSGDVGRSFWYAQADMDGICVHPYGKTPEAAVVLLQTYADEFQSPVWAGEFHEVDGYTREDYFKEFEAAAFNANYYCYSDAMNPGFGMKEMRP